MFKIRLPFRATLISSLFLISAAEVRAAEQAPPPSDFQYRFVHNGSLVMVDPGTGYITYVEPKKSLEGVVQPGAVLFKGKIENTSGQHDKVSGIAFSYKRGCEAAPYPVTGGFLDNHRRIVLRGRAPVRNGCDVIAYTEQGANAMLSFVEGME